MNKRLGKIKIGGKYVSVYRKIVTWSKIHGVMKKIKNKDGVFITYYLDAFDNKHTTKESVFTFERKVKIEEILDHIELLK